MESHLATQRAAVKMLHDRILLLTKYVADVLAGPCRTSSTVHCLIYIPTLGSAKKDHATLRALSALISSLPASEDKNFREEFDTVSHLATTKRVILMVYVNLTTRNTETCN